MRRRQSPSGISQFAAIDAISAACSYDSVTHIEAMLTTCLHPLYTTLTKYIITRQDMDSDKFAIGTRDTGVSGGRRHDAVGIVSHRDGYYTYYRTIQWPCTTLSCLLRVSTDSGWLVWSTGLMRVAASSPS